MEQTGHKKICSYNFGHQSMISPVFTLHHTRGKGGSPLGWLALIHSVTHSFIHSITVSHSLTQSNVHNENDSIFLTFLFLLPIPSFSIPSSSFTHSVLVPTPSLTAHHTTISLHPRTLPHNKPGVTAPFHPTRVPWGRHCVPRPSPAARGPTRIP